MPSIVARFREAFVTGLGKTMRERKMDLVLCFVTLVYWVAAGGIPKLRSHFWESVTPWVWILSFLISRHAYLAAMLLRRELLDEESATRSRRRSLILSQFGTPYELPKEGKRSYLAKIGTIVLLIFLACGSVSYFVWDEARNNENKHPQTESESRTSDAGTREKPPHALLVRYEQQALPITVPSKSTALVLRLNPTIERWFYEFRNDRNRPMNWPEDLHPGKKVMPEMTYVCELTNNEQNALMDVAIEFNISFHELEEIPGAKETLNEDGTHSITLPRPGADHVVYSDGRGNNIKAIRDGQTIKSLTFSASVPAIRPGETERVYLVNQSKYIAKFTFPNTATAVTSGEFDRVKVRLIRPDTNVTDRLPWFGLAPPKYHWKGVAGAP